MLLLLCSGLAGGGWVLFAVGCQANCYFSLPRALKRINLVHLLNMVQLFVCRHRCSRLSVGTERSLGPRFTQRFIVADEQSSVAGEMGCAGVPAPHAAASGSLGPSPSWCLLPLLCCTLGGRAPRCRSGTRQHPADVPDDFSVRAVLRI